MGRTNIAFLLLQLFLRVLFLDFLYPLESGCLPESSETISSSVVNEEERLEALYLNLNPVSMSELFAFHLLYPHRKQGQRALKEAGRLLHRLSGQRNGEWVQSELGPQIAWPMADIQSLILSFSFQRPISPISLTEEQIVCMERFGRCLSNRKLRGFSLWDSEDILSLPSNEVDLSRALFLHHFNGQNEKGRKKIRQYEALLDAMALQILAHLSTEATPVEKIQAINHFLFYDQRFRYPPPSLDKGVPYSQLSSVIESRRGVCLGLSVLYLALAQRLGLALEAVTPPGHIYLRCRTSEGFVNIETTARGIHLPSDYYLDVNTHYLQVRSCQEVVGLVFLNRSLSIWQNREYMTALEELRKALSYLPEELSIHALMGYLYLLTGKEKVGKSFLKKAQAMNQGCTIYPDPTPEDFLSGHVDIKGVQAWLEPVEDSPESLYLEERKMREIVKKHPRFRAGHLKLATIYLKLQREKEAFEELLAYHRLDSSHPKVEYLLSYLSINRLHYSAAWFHLNRVKKITRKQGDRLKCIKKLQHILKRISVDPNNNQCDSSSFPYERQQSHLLTSTRKTPFQANPACFLVGALRK